MVEYLLVHGSGLKSGFNFNCLKIFDNDHCRQPAAVKDVILECQCEDVIGVKVLKSELRRRSSAVDSDMEYNWNANIEICLRRKRRKSLVCLWMTMSNSCLMSVLNILIPMTGNSV